MHRSLRMGQGVRFEVPVRGGGHGVLVIGQKNCFGYRPAFRLGTGEILLQARDPNAEIIIGHGNSFSNNVCIIANKRISIGNGCRIGDLVAFYDCDFHELDPRTRGRGCGPTQPVAIGNNVWLGSRVVVLKGVNIGDNSVVAAMSVVNKSIPANSVAAGVPAKVVRIFDSN